MPGDSIIPTAEAWIFDIQAGVSRQVDVEPQPGGFTSNDTVYSVVQWTSDSKRLFYTTRSRDYKTNRLYNVDARTGQATQVLEEDG